MNVKDVAMAGVGVEGVISTPGAIRCGMGAELAALLDMLQAQGGLHVEYRSDCRFPDVPARQATNERRENRWPSN